MRSIDAVASLRHSILQRQLLEQIPGYDEESSFARVWPEKETSNGLGLIVIIRTVLVFTIHLEVEGRRPMAVAAAIRCTDRTM